MKKITATLCFLALTVFGFSQSIQLFKGTTNVTNDTIVVPITANSFQNEDIDIHNVSSNAINFLVKRVILNGSLDSTCIVYFCTGFLCYLPSTNMVYTEPGSGNALAANTNLLGSNGLIPHFDVGANCCETYILYKVYNTLLPNDTARVTMHYKCVSGVDDINKTGGIMSSAFPNPTNDFISIKYNINEFSTKGKIIFYDMLGKVVKQVVLQDKQGHLKMNVSDFNSGIYFYTFEVDEKAILTKKLVISSK